MLLGYKTGFVRLGHICGMMLMSISLAVELLNESNLLEAMLVYKYFSNLLVDMYKYSTFFGPHSMATRT